MSELHKKPLYSCHEREISYREQNHFLHQAANIFISAVKLSFLMWGSMGIGSLLEPASTSHSRNCSSWRFSVGFVFQPRRLPLETRLSQNNKSLDDMVIEFGVTSAIMGCFFLVSHKSKSKTFFFPPEGPSSLPTGQMGCCSGNCTRLAFNLFINKTCESFCGFR